MSDDLPDDLMYPAELEAFAPRKVHPNTWCNWRTKGKRGVKLRGYLFAGKYMHSLREFMAFLHITTKKSDAAGNDEQK